MVDNQEPHPSSRDVIAVYERHAARWDEDRLKILFERGWLDRFKSQLPEGGTILDLGCGSGEPLAKYLIEQGHALTGVDSSPSMVAMCQHRFPAHCWLNADMRTFDIGRTFDGILAWDSFFHLTPDDQRMMFRVFRRHAHQGSALMFTSGSKHGEAIGEYRGAPLYHASLDPTEYERLLRNEGFGIVRSSLNDVECDRHCVWLAALTSSG